MLFTDTPIAGAVKIGLKKVVDDRGWFARGWCTDEFRACGLNPNLVQINLGFSHQRGTLRGMHYQLAPHAETKCVRCTRGAVFDVVVDLRPASPTFTQWHGLTLTEDNDTMLCIPEGCAHGYQTLTDNAEIYYLTSALYAASAAQGVRYDDATFDIRWPLPVSVISKADASWPPFSIPAIRRPVSL